MHSTPDGRPLFPVAVLVLVIREGKILLGKRKGGYGEGAWCLPGGHLEYGETLLAAAQRELLEETGLHAQNLVFKNIVNRKGEPSHYVHITFLAEGVKGEPEVREPESCEAWQWFPLDNLPEPLFEWNVDPIGAFRDGRTLVDSVKK